MPPIFRALDDRDGNAFSNWHPVHLLEPVPLHFRGSRVAALPPKAAFSHDRPTCSPWRTSSSSNTWPFAVGEGSGLQSDDTTHIHNSCAGAGLLCLPGAQRRTHCGSKRLPNILHGHESEDQYLTILRLTFKNHTLWELGVFCLTVMYRTLVCPIFICFVTVSSLNRLTDKTHFSITN